jgi:hypothetical protein
VQAQARTKACRQGGLRRTSAGDNRVQTRHGCCFRWSCHDQHRLHQLPFVSDTFTGADGTALTSHTGETGATWTRHTSYAAFTVPNIQGNRLAPNDGGNNNCVVYPSGSPGTADCQVQGDFWFSGTKALGLSLVLRLDVAADTFYWFRHNPSTNNWELIKRVAGANTTLGTFNDTGFTTGVTRVGKLSAVGTAIKCYVDGTQQISVTDSAISSAGKAGVLAQGDSSAGRIRLDNFTADDLTVPGAGTIGSATVDRFARVTLPYTVGTGGAPTTLVVSRSADNVTFADVSSQCDITNNGSGSWTVIDRRPHTGSQPVPTYGGTGYYKIAGSNLGGTGANTAVKTVASIDIDRNSCEQNRAATISGIMAGSSVASNSNEKYPSYHCTAMAYGYYKFGTAQYKTDCLNQFNYIKNSLTNVDGLIQIFGDTSYINRDSHVRTLVHVATAARLLRSAGATADAATLIAQCDIWAKAYFDKLNSGNPAPTFRFSGWDANNTTAFNAQTVWQATHAYSLGEVRRPTSTNNRTYRVTTPGTSAGSEPTWPTADGATVTDGTVVWTETSVTVACSYASYSSTPPYTGVAGTQASDLNQQAEEALMCAALLTDPDSAFAVAGTYRTKATNHLSAAIQIILAHETSIGAIPIGTASGETPTATTSKRYYDTLYGNYMLQQVSAVQNPYTATGLSAGAVLSDEIQAEMLDGAAYTAAFFPVATHTVDAILASPATNTKTHTVDAVVYLAPTYLTVTLSDSSANSLTTSTASANGLTITDSVFS